MAKGRKPVEDVDDDELETETVADPADATLEDRVAHLEDILAALLTAQGETYTGAGDHLERLRGHIDKAR